jgi:dTMP kinase
MFITFEGPEGGGKSTLVRSIGAYLESQGRSVLSTREPGAGILGGQIRNLLLHGEGISAETELFLFLADRSHHVSTMILPALSEGKIVLCDRFSDSTRVYQGYARGLNDTFLKLGNDFATHGLEPDLTFLLDLDPEVGLSRIKNRDRLDAEPIEFHHKVREGFVSLCKSEPERWRLIDADQPSQLVEAEVIQILTERLELRQDPTGRETGR